MSRDQFILINKNIQFAENTTRSSSKSVDTFAHTWEVFQLFTANCWANCSPDYRLTIDEQIVPLKFRCRFASIMPKNRINSESSSRCGTCIISYTSSVPMKRSWEATFRCQKMRWMTSLTKDLKLLQTFLKSRKCYISPERSLWELCELAVRDEYSPYNYKVSCNYNFRIAIIVILW